MRQDEEFGRDIFDQHLRTILPANKLKWVDGNQNVPPDFYLLIDNSEFAVEVTRLETFVRVDGKRLPLLAVEKNREDFVNTIEKEAVKRGILKGTYALAFSSTAQVPNFRRYRNQLQSKLLTHIEKTQRERQHSGTVISVDNKQLCEIMKTRSDGRRVFVGISPGKIVWEATEQQEAAEILKKSIATKAQKLEDLTQPKILILLHRNPFVELEFYRQCLTQGIRNIEAFHTVFIIHTFRESTLMLTSQDPTWTHNI